MSTSDSQIHPAALLRLPEVLKLVPVSRSTWWAGVRSGRFPAAVKLGPRTTAWRASDVLALIEQVSRADRSAQPTAPVSR